MVGPAANALITGWLGWQWAIAWPALLILLARAAMGRTIRAVPWHPDQDRAPVRARAGVVVAAVLALASWGSTVPNGIGFGALVSGTLVGAVAIGAFLVRGLPGGGRMLLAFGLLCATYFSGYELLALAVIEGLGDSILVASFAVTGALLAWSLIGLRPRPNGHPDPTIVGPVLLTAALGLLIVGLAVGAVAGTVLVIVAAVVAGAGMGAAYALLSSAPFSTGHPASRVGALIAFAETAATAWAVSLAGGLYSALHGSGWSAIPALQTVFVVLAIVGTGAIIVSALRTGARRPGSAVRRPHRARRSGAPRTPSDPDPARPAASTG